MEEKRETFTYTYSAAQQNEVKRIREKYAPPTQEQDKMEQLRRLDASVTKAGTAVSLIVGIISTLILGIGMSSCMVWKEALFIPGIVIGVIGIVGICAAYPLYARITAMRRKKIAPEIMRLSDELLK
mgnify:FL=1